MAHELITRPECDAVFAPQYFGSVDYYALLSTFGKVYIDVDMMADKRFKSVHRCHIVDTRDEIMLTVPVSHPHGRHRWSETPVSAHGRWWHVHLTALESAYGRTPFFEYYIDKFSSIFTEDYDNNVISAGELDEKIDRIVREILGIDNTVVYGSPDGFISNDFRTSKDISLNSDVIYYQLRADKLGFRRGLSVLDLIFNTGPEAPLYLRKTAEV